MATDSLGFFAVALKAGEEASVEVPAGRVLHISGVCLKRALKPSGHPHPPRASTLVAAGQFAVCHLEQGRVNHASLKLFFVAGNSPVRLLARGTASLDVTGFFSEYDDDGGGGGAGTGAAAGAAAPPAVARNGAAESDSDSSSNESSSEPSSPPDSPGPLDGWAAGKGVAAPSSDEVSGFRVLPPQQVQQFPQAPAPGKKKRKGEAPQASPVSGDGGQGSAKRQAVACDFDGCAKRFSSRVAMLQHATAKHTRK